MNSSRYKVTKKDIDGAFWRWFFGAQISWNYETMQSGGVALCLMPILRKIYKNDEDLKKELDLHFAFFNTNPWSANIILGATIALEENHDPNDLEGSREAITSIKTGLMGPLAGVGDAILFIIPMTIFGAMAGYMGLEGSPLGLMFGLAYGVAMIFVRRFLFRMGYSQGSKFVTSLSNQLKSLTNSASILGLMVVGALIASTVSVTIPFTFQQGEVQLGLQSILDMIMPNLIPACLVGLVYWLLGRKGMTSTKAIFLILLISFVGYFTGIFGVAGA